MANGKAAIKGCDRDEFPPRYFWPGDSKAPKDSECNRSHYSLFGWNLITDFFYSQ